MKKLLFSALLFFTFAIAFTSCSKEQTSLGIDQILKYGITSKQDFIILAEANTYPFNKMSAVDLEAFAESLVFDQTTLRGFRYKILKDVLNFQDFILAYDVLFGQKIYFEFDEYSLDRNWAELLKQHNQTLGGLRTYPICKIDRRPLNAGGCDDKKDDCCVF